MVALAFLVVGFLAVALLWVTAVVAALSVLI